MKLKTKARENENMINAIKIDYLANHPDWAPIIAYWTYFTWHKYDPTLTLEGSLARIKTRLNTDKIPLTLVAIHNNTPIGTVNLKNSVPVPNAPKDKIWLGSFYVEPTYKNKGVDFMLLESIYKEALRLGLDEIYVFESDPSTPTFYERHGWEIVDRLPYQNHTVILMRWKAPK